MLKKSIIAIVISILCMPIFSTTQKQMQTKGGLKINGWSSGSYPDKLKIAMKNSDKVISAWDGDRLIGLMNVILEA